MPVWDFSFRQYLKASWFKDLQKMKTLVKCGQKDLEQMWLAMPAGPADGIKEHVWRTQKSTIWMSGLTEKYGSHWFNCGQ